MKTNKKQLRSNVKQYIYRKGHAEIRRKKFSLEEHLIEMFCIYCDYDDWNRYDPYEQINNYCFPRLRSLLPLNIKFTFQEKTSLKLYSKEEEEKYQEVTFHFQMSNGKTKTITPDRQEDKECRETYEDFVKKYEQFHSKKIADALAIPQANKTKQIRI